MRILLLALVATAALALPGRAGDLRNFDDAALHAVQFVDRDEGWAVGDDGVIWHTIDAGRDWERQPTGVRSSLRSVHFLNPFTGWVVGREELPGGGSVGIMLFTQDGGLRWRRLGNNELPGLNAVRFRDNQHGYVVGDGTEQYPTGIFATENDGRTWRSIRGKRYPAWLAADLGRDGRLVLAGAWNRLATLHDGQVSDADVDAFAGRNVNAVHVHGDRAVAVAQGGLVLQSDNGGIRWRVADLHLPSGVRADWDFHGVHCQGDQLWVVGRPGSAVLHSADAGKNWEVLPTHQPLPLDGVFFADGQRGWAVGELGSILGTEDGGKTWTVERRGGQRAALMFVHAQGRSIPLDAVAQLGGQEGYLTVGLRVNRPDPDSAAPGQASADGRLAMALRQAGGAAGEVLWQFPLAEHQFRAEPAALLKTWDRLLDDRAAEALVRQLVLSLRTWRPDVIVTDSPEDGVGLPVERLVSRALREAYAKAADATDFPDQLKTLGLEPWKVSKLYGPEQGKPAAAAEQAIVETNEACPVLRDTARDFAGGAAELLGVAPASLPSSRSYRLYESRVPAVGRGLMDGVRLAPGGTARRSLTKATPPAPDLLRSIRERRDLEAIVAAPSGKLTNFDGMVAQLAPALAHFPEDRAANMLYAIAGQYARLGRWPLARELYTLLIDRYPNQARATDAYRWLIQDAGSSESRRRDELRQAFALNSTEFEAANGKRLLPGDGLHTKAVAVSGGAQSVRSAAVGLLRNPTAARKAYERCLELGKQMRERGVSGVDPAAQFCLQASRRNLGDFEGARHFYQTFVNEHPNGPWHDAAAAELWLLTRVGPPPKPVAYCRRTDARPFLDGQLNDSCWQNLNRVTFSNVAGTSARDYPTEAWLAYDSEFLYLAVRCRHPAGHFVAPIKVRPRDADVRPYDRVGLLLDLDRDYGTYFHLQIDQRGCVCDSFCQGDATDWTWDPRWFVAVHSEPTFWQAEAAIPMAELTGDPITIGHAWACNLVRIIPGQGVQAWSTPAGVKPRPEGMGLMMFSGG